MDRLSELKGKYAQDDVSFDVDAPATRGDMDEFFRQVKVVQDGIKGIDQCTEDIKAKHSEALMNTDSDKTKAISAELDDLIQLVVAKSTEVKAGLKMIEEQIKLMDTTARPAEVRIRQNQHQLLLKHFINSMKAYQDASEQYSQKYREQVKRRIKTRFNAENGETLNEVEVDRLATQLLDEGKEDSIFQQCKDVYEQIQENHRDILRIERSMRELNQMFADMALLVEEQGELMDDIAHNVSKSVAYVQKGTQELKQAKVYAKKSRKLMCCVLLVLLAIAAAIAIPLVLTNAFK
eukprot:EG_transcript_17067